MGDSLSCSECGAEAESVDDVETADLDEVEVTEDGSFNLFGNTDLFLCKDCKNPLGMRKK